MPFPAKIRAIESDQTGHNYYTMNLFWRFYIQDSIERTKKVKCSWVICVCILYTFLFNLPMLLIAIASPSHWIYRGEYIQFILNMCNIRPRFSIFFDQYTCTSSLLSFLSFLHNPSNELQTVLPLQFCNHGTNWNTVFIIFGWKLC